MADLSASTTSYAPAAPLLLLSAANWAYTWLTAGWDADELADSLAAILVDGIRGYATRP